MRVENRFFSRFLGFFSVLVLASCGGGGGGGTSQNTTPDSFTVSVNVSGLSDNLVLQNNGTDDLNINADGDYTFPTPLKDTDPFDITVFSQPTGQDCSVYFASGVISGANEATSYVHCVNTGAPTYTVGGTVTGLAGTLVLQNNGVGNLSISQDGTFSFITEFTDTSPYNVSIATQPAGQTCSVSNGAGSINGTDINAITVSCVNNTSSTYLVSVNVTGVSGSLVLQNNNADDLTINTAGVYSFATPLVDLSSYTVSIVSEPTGQRCSLFDNGGFINGANPDVVNIRCVSSTTGNPGYTIGGQVTGLNGTLFLRSTSGQEWISVNSDGAFSFKNVLFTNHRYEISIAAHPEGQSCSLSNYSGLVGTEDVNTINVSCTNGTPAEYIVRGTVSGLDNTLANLVLTNDGGDSITLTDNGNFSFPTALKNFQRYFVTWAAQPEGHYCVVFSADGTVNSADVSVNVLCKYSSPMVINITGSEGLVSINDTLGAAGGISANGDGIFNTNLLYQTSPVDYSFQVAAQPAGQVCELSNGTGTVIKGEILATPVLIVCNGDALSYSLGGNVTGLNGSLIIGNISNGVTEYIDVTENGVFNFANQIADSNGYSVVIGKQPVDQSCVVSNPSGTINNADVTTVSVACTGPGAPLYSVGGSLSGLNGTVVLSNNNADSLSISANGSFSFAGSIYNANAYHVQIASQPIGQTCALSNASGVVDGVDVQNVSVICSDIPTNIYSVGGSVSGLSGNLVLQNNASDNLSIVNNGNFSFAGLLNDTDAYNVTVASQPVGQVCSLSNSSGAVNASHVTNLIVECVSSVAQTYTVGGNVTGLSGYIVLQNNGGSNLTLRQDGSFTFINSFSDVSSYNVSVLSQPSGQVCNIVNASGVISGANVDTVAVTCSAAPIQQYSVGGSVNGLTGSLVLSNNNAESLTLSSGGSFTFLSLLDDASPYSVSIQSQPAGQVCSVANASGLLNGSNITTVNVICESTVSEYSVTGSVEGLDGSLTLKNTNGDSITLNATGSAKFAFPTRLLNGASYSVSVFAQPSNQSCVVTSAAGVVSLADVTDVLVSCGVTYLSSPQNHVASTGFGEAVRHSWDAVPGADFYEVYSYRKVYNYTTNQYEDSYTKVLQTADTFFEFPVTSSSIQILIRAASNNGVKSGYSTRLTGSYGASYYPELYFAPRNLRASKGDFPNQIEICWDYAHVPSDYYDDNRGAIVVKVQSQSGYESILVQSAWLSYTNNNCVTHTGRTATPIKVTAQYQNNFINKKSEIATTYGYTSGDIDYFNVYLETEDGAGNYEHLRKSSFYGTGAIKRDFYPRDTYRYMIKEVKFGQEQTEASYITRTQSNFQPLNVSYYENNGSFVVTWDPVSSVKNYVINYSYEPLAKITGYGSVETTNSFTLPHSFTHIYVDVFALTQPFGDWDRTHKGSIYIANLPDADNDDVPDSSDICPGTIYRIDMDASGCSAYQRGDNDKDGVVDGADQCNGTHLGETVDLNGCSHFDLNDKDRDLVDEPFDVCLNTSFNASVDASGCSTAQLDDSDLDTVPAWADSCPDTPAGVAVSANGCSASQLSDTDADGVMDAYDICPSTGPVKVDFEGCTFTQRVDQDLDKVFDYLDQCLNTPAGEAVSTDGCSVSQITDSDNDGLVDALDKCSGTLSGETINLFGCSQSQVDISYPVQNLSAIRYNYSDPEIIVTWLVVPSAKEYRLRFMNEGTSTVVREFTVNNTGFEKIFANYYKYFKFDNYGAGTIEVQAYFDINAQLIAGAKSQVSIGQVENLIRPAPETVNETTTATNQGQTISYDTPIETGYSAGHCIQIGLARQYEWSKTDQRYIQNICESKVSVKWCQNGVGGDNSAQCGGSKYYPKWLIFDSGRRYFNQFSVPTEVSVFSFAACYGISNFETDSEGSYQCPK